MSAHSITGQDAITMLADEGYAVADVEAAIDSMIAAGLELDQPDEGLVLTGTEVDLLRDQLWVSP